MRNRPLLLASVATLVTAALSATAAPTVGSGNVAVIEPPIAVPNEAPCVVPLVTGAIFGASNSTYSYTPPASCPGPWAKVVLGIDVSVQKGIQYDRTGTLWMGGVPLWFGTTAEPNPHLSPSWHFERDLTDYTALFKTAQTGYELITNYTNSTDNSLITSSAILKFYPATAAYPAPATPDLVLPFSATGGGTVALNTPTDTLSSTVALPTNVKSATLALYLQGQSTDEFWYTCVPSSLSSELESCGSGAFREGEVTVDGTPAGVAPVYPWIFTGGIDPNLWAPIPGVQTLSFTPFSVPLSPFAGVLSNGSPHTLAVSVFGADSYFSAAGVLFVTLDPTTSAITGSVLSNTLAAQPMVTTVPNITTSSSATTGTVDTAANHDFTIVGEIMTSAGKVTNTVQESTIFSNDQYFDLTSALYVQKITQSTTTSVDEKSAGPRRTSSETQTSYKYPLTVNIREVVNATGSGTQLTTIDQKRIAARIAVKNGKPAGQSAVANAIHTTDDLSFANGYITGNKDQSEIASLLTSGTDETCFYEVLTAARNKLTADTAGCYQ